MRLQGFTEPTWREINPLATDFLWVKDISSVTTTEFKVVPWGSTKKAFTHQLCFSIWADKAATS